MYENLSFLYGSGSYAVYLRKSRRDLDAEARGESETLERHFQILKALARQMHLNIQRVYAEVVSGETIDARPQMQLLLRDVETGAYDGVLVVEVERLARGDTSDQGRVAKTFKLSNTLIITPAKTYDPNNEYDEEYFEFGLFMSRREYKTIRRRLTAGSEASRREGKFTGNIAPYGYERYKLSKEKGWSLRIIPEQASVVRMIFDWYLNGIDGDHVGYTNISYQLNRLGIPSPSGSSWTPYGVQNILRNPVYAGYIKNGYRRTVKKMSEGRTVQSRPVNHDAVLYPGRHEAIISQDIWDAIHRRMVPRYINPSSPKRAQQNPLSGLVVCSCCRRVMQRRPYQNGRTASLICTTKGCPTVSSDLNMVEKRVLDALDSWLTTYELSDPGVLPDNSEKISILEKSISACKTEMQEAENQINRQYDLLERGIYTEQEFFDRNARMKKKKNELSAHLAKLHQELLDENSARNAMERLLPALRTIHDAYLQIDNPAVRNHLLREVIDHIEYTKSEGGRWGNPESFTLEIFPKLR